MFDASHISQSSRSAGAAGISSNQNSSVSNPIAHGQPHSAPFTPKIVERRNAQGSLERGVMIPCADRFFTVETQEHNKLPRSGMEVRIVFDDADFPNIALPQHHPANNQEKPQSLALIPAGQAQQAVRAWKAQVSASDKFSIPWRFDALDKSFPTGDITPLLNWKDPQGRNILSHAAEAGVEAMAAVRMTLARQVCGHFEPRISFKTSLKEAEVKNLHEKVRNAWGSPLSDEQVAAIARFVEVADLKTASRHAVVNALHPIMVTGFRPLFEAARAVYASSACDINERNAADDTCLHDLSHMQVASHPWDNKESDCVSIAERLSVMLELGADPFDKGSNGKLASAFEQAQARACPEVAAPLEKIRKTMHGLAMTRDSKLRSAICHASSASVVNFLCDLGCGSLLPYQSITAPDALSQWLRRNPSELMIRLSNHATSHPLANAPTGIIAAYLDAISARPHYDDSYHGDVKADIRKALDWKVLAEDVQVVQREGKLTLFNCSASIECAEILLQARMNARSGDAEWKDWCDDEWDYLIHNPDSHHRSQPLPSIALADLLTQEDIAPSEQLLSLPGRRKQWTLFQKKDAEYRTAMQLWETIQQSNFQLGSLKKSEWKLIAAHAYHLVLRLPDEQCKAVCAQIANYLASKSKCDKEIRIAFLRTAGFGKLTLGDTEENAARRLMWSVTVGQVANTFCQRENGKLEKVVEDGMHRKYVAEWARKVADRQRKKEASTGNA